MNWQPIETAPTDGTDYLAYSDARREFGLAYYSPMLGIHCHTSYGEFFNPTHWCAVEPPKETP